MQKIFLLSFISLSLCAADGAQLERAAAASSSSSSAEGAQVASIDNLLGALFPECGPLTETVTHMATLMLYEAQQNDDQAALQWLFNRRSSFEDVAQRLPHIAAQNGQHMLVQKLLKQNNNINVRDGLGRLPFDYACENGHILVVKDLLSDPDQRMLIEQDIKDRWHTSLILAIHNGHHEVVEELLKNVYKKEELNHECFQPLGFACSRKKIQNGHNHKKIIQLLLDHGADINGKTIQGTTSAAHSPLMKALKNNEGIFALSELLGHDGLSLDCLIYGFCVAGKKSETNARVLYCYAHERGLGTVFENRAKQLWVKRSTGSKESAVATFDNLIASIKDRACIAASSHQGDTSDSESEISSSFESSFSDDESSSEDTEGYLASPDEG